MIHNKYKRHHRGMTFIELIVSLVIIGVVSTGIISAANVMIKSYNDALIYTSIYNSTNNIINLIRDDLENGIDIQGEDYTNLVSNNKLKVDVTINDLGEIFGNKSYMLNINLSTYDNKVSNTSNVIVIKGCVISET